MSVVQYCDGHFSIFKKSIYPEYSQEHKKFKIQMPLQGREREFKCPILTNFMVSTPKKEEKKTEIVNSKFSN